MPMQVFRTTVFQKSTKRFFDPPYSLPLAQATPTTPDPAEM